MWAPSCVPKTADHLHRQRSHQEIHKSSRVVDTKNGPINVLSLDRCNWGGVLLFTVIAKDILAMAEYFFCTKKKYIFFTIWNEMTTTLVKKWNSIITYYIEEVKGSVQNTYFLLFMWGEFTLCGTHSFCVLHFKVGWCFFVINDMLPIIGEYIS